MEETQSSYIRIGRGFSSVEFGSKHVRIVIITRKTNKSSLT